MDSMENSKIAALVELGILCRGEPVDVVGDGGADHGPHVYSGHDQLCRFEHEMHRRPFEDKSISTYSFYPDDLAIESALSQTRLVILLGAADSGELTTCLASPGTVVVLFEPDERVLVECLESVGLARLNRENFFCFTGDPMSFNPALQDLLPVDMFKMGTPAFFMTDRIRGQYADWAHQVIEYFEVLHYRHVIYPFAGQALTRSHPVRKIHRGLLYDQQLHAYQNVPAFMTTPTIEALRDVMKDVPAILVAAGPELSGKLDYIRANMGKALVICVNNAVKSLTDAGIIPHVVIINDTSVASGQIFDHIPEMPDTILVAHCLSELGGEKFRKRYLFGSFLPQLFGEREMLRLHGSVISTAFSLACHMGCPRCILIGAQLASDNPWGLSYAKGAVGKDVESQDRPLIGRYPQLYPVKTPLGEQVYTTTNFLDSALWLAETIRLSGVECINTSRGSILYGSGIEHDPAPELEDCAVDAVLANLPQAGPPAVDREGIRRYLRHELKMWMSILGVADTMLGLSGEELRLKGMAILDQLDKNNVSYMVERHCPPENSFVSPEFYRLVFESDDADREKGLGIYFTHVKMISEEFLDFLRKAAQAV